VASWVVFAVGLALVELLQWAILFNLPLSLTYYQDGMAQRRRIRLGELVRHMVRGRVEMHGPLLYVDLGDERGNIGAHWSVLALATLIVGPWVLRTP
jgi:cytochrome c-type biogenesis protein CcmE